MARPRSEDKREAILRAAITAIAEHGSSAPTKLIAKDARIAEGTIFRYFPTKDDLLNAVFLSLKIEFRENTKNGQGNGEAFLRLEWDRYIDWGTDHPAASKALSRLTASDRIWPQTHAKANALFPELLQVCQSSADQSMGAQGELFLNAMFFALAQTVIAFSLKEPSSSDGFKSAGFEMLMAAMGKPEALQ